MDITKSKKDTREHLINLMTELIKYPSHLNEPLKTFELANFIKSYFKRDKIFINEFVVHGLPALVITTENTRHPHILLSGHIDVVPSSNRYTARLDGDYLYGGGAMDMKGGVACMMAVMKYYSEQKNPPSLGLMLTADEETGGRSASALLNEENYNADFCIINEGRHSYDLVVREKGLMVVRLNFKTKCIHSAYPWKGKNALEDLMKFCLTVKKRFPKPRDAWIPTVSATSINIITGAAMNTIPGEVEATLCFRLIETKKWSRGNIAAMLKRLAPPEAEIKEILFGNVFSMDTNNSRVKLMKNVAQEVTKKRIRFGENHGASDARFFAKKGIPTVVLGPVGKDHHAEEECVSVSSVETHLEVLRRFIEEESGVFASTTKMLAKK